MFHADIATTKSELVEVTTIFCLCTYEQTDQKRGNKIP